MGSLDGLKILDFSTLLPGPYATLMLADMGVTTTARVQKLMREANLLVRLTTRRKLCRQQKRKKSRRRH